MYVLDAAEIGLMPPRGTASLWPIRILTDFGKDGICAVGAGGVLFVVLRSSAPRLRGTRAIRCWLGFGTRCSYVSCRAACRSRRRGDQMDRRPRPAVCRRRGQRLQLRAHFAGTEAYFSFPSGHAITAFALAFAVSAIWPRLRIAMIVYALVIAATPARAAGASSERRGRGRAGRRRRRDVGALLVCRAPARVRHRPRRRGCAACRARRWAASKGLPAAPFAP